MNFIQTVILWLFLNIIIVATLQLALYTQTTNYMENAPFSVKLISSEFWASIEWMFIVPAQRLGITFLNPAQLVMSSCIFDFLSQIWANIFWLKLPTTIDDYAAMLIILFGMYITKFQVLG